jgi:uncharacterized protein (DUF362 family)
MSAIVKPGDRVLLKPNLLTGSRPQEVECITRPELVCAVAEMVMAAGGEPFLGDSPAFGSAFRVGFRALCLFRRVSGSGKFD